LRRYAIDAARADEPEVWPQGHGVGEPSADAGIERSIAIAGTAEVREAMEDQALSECELRVWLDGKDCACR
jgi:hypothetical protein